MLLRQVTRGESSGSRGGRSPINLLLLRSAFLSVSLSGSLSAASAANSWQKVRLVRWYGGKFVRGPSGNFNISEGVLVNENTLSGKV
jgi:hypothetical protein